MDQQPHLPHGPGGVSGSVQFLHDDEARAQLAHTDQLAGVAEDQVAAHHVVHVAADGGGKFEVVDADVVQGLVDARRREGQT